MKIMKRKRWRRNREKIPRRKRTQVLLQGIVIKWLYCMLCYHYVYHEVSRRNRHSDAKA
jgi:hypothetical protein